MYLKILQTKMEKVPRARNRMRGNQQIVKGSLFHLPTLTGSRARESTEDSSLFLPGSRDREMGGCWYWWALENKMAVKIGKSKALRFVL